MVDLIPEGCVPLTEAFDQYRSWLWNGHLPVAELHLGRILGDLPSTRASTHRARLDEVTDFELTEVVRALAGGHIAALARNPTQPEIITVPVSAWEEAFFPERMFLANVIRAGHGDYFDAMTGSTPFVRQAELSQFLDNAPNAASSRRRDLPPVIALRTALIGLVNDGVLRSDEAEEYARTWGLKPLSRKPDEEQFDPMARSAWTLTMTLAWVAWRQLPDVRDAWDEYRHECWEWRGFNRRLPIDGGKEWYEVHGEELQPLSPMTIGTLGLLEALDEDDREPSKLVSIKSAREDLWQKLGDGNIIATGLDLTENVTSIPSNEWGYLEPAMRLDGPEYLVFSHKRYEAAYTKVTLQRKVVLELWPPIKTAPTPDIPIPANKVNGSARKLRATRRALAELYTDGRPPEGLTEKERLNAINAWHKKNGSSQVSRTTVRRAMKRE